jgi:hypothetical protein
MRSCHFSEMRTVTTSGAARHFTFLDSSNTTMIDSIAGSFHDI